MNWLLLQLRTPTAFLTDPWAYLRNQAGHGYLIGGLGTIIFGLWPVLILYAVWEAIQRSFYGADLSDDIEDFANVAAVALAVSSGRAEPLIIHALVLAAGFFWRREQRNKPL